MDEGCVIMTKEFQSYQAIKDWKNQHISQNQSNTYTLNTFHDCVMKEVFKLAFKSLDTDSPPCSFAWFITGSGGRFEQGLISDQDHGIVYKNNDVIANEYFKALGEEISIGLNIVGYPYCEGNVMSSNPKWCKPLELWQEQLLHWMDEGSFQTIRNLQIFFDARLLIGDDYLLNTLKRLIFQYQKEHPKLTQRLMENVSHVKNAVGPLGQIIVEEKGIHAGAVDLKYAAFLPYVNAIRLLAIKEGISETSTLKRLDQLMNINSQYYDVLSSCKNNFLRLLELRISLLNTSDSYDDIHYLKINKLTRQEKKELKQILKDGKKLHQYVNVTIEKGC